MVIMRKKSLSQKNNFCNYKITRRKKKSSMAFLDFLKIWETVAEDHSCLIRTGSVSGSHNLLVITALLLPSYWSSDMEQVWAQVYFCPFQIANHTGYITVDWKRVEQDVNKAKKQLKLNTEKPSKEVKTKVQEVTEWGLIAIARPDGATQTPDCVWNWLNSFNEVVICLKFCPDDIVQLYFWWNTQVFMSDWNGFPRQKF